MVLEADGVGLTLVHEDGLPRWVAATDAAMELLEQVQHDFGEGPYLQAYAQDRAVSIQDLGAAPTWARVDAVVGQLLVRAVLSAPSASPASRWEPWTPTAPSDQAQVAAEERDRVADERDRTAGHHD